MSVIGRRSASGLLITCSGHSEERGRHKARSRGASNRGLKKRVFGPLELANGGKGPEGQAVGVIQRLSEADAFLAVGDPFLELSPVSENHSQIAVGYQGRKSGEAK